MYTAATPATCDRCGPGHSDPRRSLMTAVAAAAFGLFVLAMPGYAQTLAAVEAEGHGITLPVLGRFARCNAHGTAVEWERHRLRPSLQKDKKEIDS